MPEVIHTHPAQPHRPTPLSLPAAAADHMQTRLVLMFPPPPPWWPSPLALTVSLYAFCIVFAVNSSIHSYLIVAYAEGDKVCQLHSAPYFPCCEAT